MRFGLLSFFAVVAIAAVGAAIAAPYLRSLAPPVSMRLCFMAAALFVGNVVGMYGRWFFLRSEERRAGRLIKKLSQRPGDSGIWMLLFFGLNAYMLKWDVQNWAREFPSDGMTYSGLTMECAVIGWVGFYLIQIMRARFLQIHERGLLASASALVEWRDVYFFEWKGEDLVVTKPGGTICIRCPANEKKELNAIFHEHVVRSSDRRTPRGRRWLIFLVVLIGPVIAASAPLINWLFASRP